MCLAFGQKQLKKSSIDGKEYIINYEDSDALGYY
jgi:hypothetical protein